MKLGSSPSSDIANQTREWAKVLIISTELKPASAPTLISRVSAGHPTTSTATATGSGTLSFE
jgi:hypothetical protein